MPIKLLKLLDKQSLEERIRVRAYQIWLEQDKPFEKETEHWKQAEQEFALIKTFQQVAKYFILTIPKWLIFTLPKTEWVKLLAVPLALGALGSIVTSQLQNESRQTSALNDYYSQLETLAFTKGLLKDNPDREAVLIARARTLVALRSLDQKRKQQLLGFLQDSGLLSSKQTSRNSQAYSIISFENTDLTGINLEGADLRSANFRLANLKDANLRYARFSIEKSDPIIGDGEREFILYTNVEGANFFNADLSNADLRNTDLRKASFYFAIMANANLRNAKLDGADFREADLTNANLSNADLHKANLSNADLHKANFNRATLVHTNLSNANLNQANMRTAIFSNALSQLRRAKLCETVLPSGIELDPDRDCDQPQISLD